MLALRDDGDVTDVMRSTPAGDIARQSGVLLRGFDRLPGLGHVRGLVAAGAPRLAATAEPEGATVIVVAIGPAP